MRTKSRGRSASRKPALPAFASDLPGGYPVAVHLGGVKTFGRMVKADSREMVWVDIKGVKVMVPATVLSTDAQSFSLVLSVRDGVVEPSVFEHRQEALGYVERYAATSVGPIPIEAPLALQLMRLLDPRGHGQKAPRPQPPNAQATPAAVDAPQPAAEAPASVAPVGAAAPSSPPASDVIQVYTDGSCLNNPGGPGGWAVLIEFPNGQRTELSDRETDTTNNRMELQAAVMALRHLIDQEHTEPVAIWTDSEYLKNGITKWLEGWKRRGWRKADDSAVLNVDLWKVLDELNQNAKTRFSLEWNWVRGHNGSPGNERADALAKQAARRTN